MRAASIPLLAVAILLGGCLQKDDPLVPELKGRWAAPNASKVRAAIMADRTSTPIPVAVNHDTNCRDQYVTFQSHGISIHIDRKVYPLFAVKEIKRDGPRLILSGAAPVPGGHKATIELLLRHGEVRFEDIIDQRGRSIRYERFDNEQARRAGVTTVGDVFRLVLDAKPCRV